MGLKIAIGGKGGVGKTTVCAVWAELFAADGFDVLALDADPNTTLALAFGLGPDRSPEALIEMKQLIAERTGTDKDSVGAYFRLNPQVSDLPEKYWVEADSKRVRLLVLGGITKAGGGCACPEGAFLKALLTHTMLQRQEIVLVDLAAGVEFMGRASIQGIDALVVVAEPGARSIETANKIGRMGRELGARYVAAIVNKITDASQIGRIEGQLTVPVLASIDYSPAVQEADLSGSRVFGSDEAVVERLRQAKDELVRVVSQA
jgi:CO dehydrogenase maturation factor